MATGKICLLLPALSPQRRADNEVDWASGFLNRY